MGQTILCDFIANWEESGAQPDPKAYGWPDMLTMLQEAQAAMFDLGASSNQNSRAIIEAAAKICETAPGGNRETVARAIRQLLSH